MISIKRISIVLILLFALPCLADNGVSFYGSGHGSASGGGGADTVYDAQVQFGSGLITAANFKVLLYNSSGTLLAESNAGTPAASTLVTVTFPGSPPTLTSSSTYHVGIIADGYLSIEWLASDYSTQYNSSGSYASPPNVTPGSDSTRSFGDMEIVIRNSSTTVLLGSLSSGDTSDATEDFTDIAHYNGGEVY